MRPPVIDGIEEHDPAGRIEELDQDSKLDNALHIEELDRAGQHRGARFPRIQPRRPRTASFEPDTPETNRTQAP